MVDIKCQHWHKASTLFEAFVNALNWHTSLKIPVLFVCQSNNPKLWLFTENIGLQKWTESSGSLHNQEVA